jgi:hypothetical protein
MKWVVVLVGFLLAGYLTIAFNWTYSDGNRAGYIQKFSRKGWVCKTHEGELAMTTVPGLAPVLWGFTVWDEQVASDLSRAMGKRVILHYHEYRYLPTACFGDTDYVVDRVEIQD